VKLFAEIQEKDYYYLTQGEQLLIVWFLPFFTVFILYISKYMGDFEFSEGAGIDIENCKHTHIYNCPSISP
jgi:hypothetical protein